MDVVNITSVVVNSNILEEANNIVDIIRIIDFPGWFFFSIIMFEFYIAFCTKNLFLGEFYFL